MHIDKFINSKTDNIQSGGGNKKCVVFDEYVLLYGSFREEELKKEITICNALKQNGVSVIPTLEYKIVVPANEYGYVKGYTLQQRAKGDMLYRHNMTKEEYTTRLKQIANMDVNKLNKFISDWLAIVNAGLQIDPSKGENFFYHDNGISFIDLNLAQGARPLKVVFLEIISVLTGLGLVTNAPTEDCTQIIEKVTQIFLRKGLKTHDIQDILSSHAYLLGKSANTKEKLPPLLMTEYLRGERNI